MADTIFALSSGRPPAGVAVVRISGPQASDALQALAGCRPPPRVARLVTLRDPADGAALDQALVLLFRGPASATGQDVVELHIHGGRAVISAVLATLGRQPGLRPAEPGEFTRRAFANGKMDLAAVEGLADLIAAETESQRRQAMHQLEGALGRVATSWREDLIRAMALVEAGLDFADEGDVSDECLTAARPVVRRLAGEIRDALRDAARGERVRDGIRVAIAGLPNAGKSSLLNALARRDVAIVSEHPGTTRDVLEVHLDLHGAAMVLADMAGLRDAADPIEQEGIARARRRIESADLVLWLEDLSVPRETSALPEGVVWRIGTKYDLIDSDEERIEGQDSFRHRISTVQNLGISTLIDDLAAFATRATCGANAVVTRERHRLALEAAVTALVRTEERSDDAPELVAEDLRQASEALGTLIGAIGVEDVLGSIFAEFCIGK